MARPVHLLVVALAERFRRQKGKDVSRDGEALSKLLEAAERAVRELQATESVEVWVPHLASDSMGPLHFRTQLTREEAIHLGGVREVEQLLD